MPMKTSIITSLITDLKKSRLVIPMVRIGLIGVLASLYFVINVPASTAGTKSAPEGADLNSLLAAAYSGDFETNFQLINEMAESGNAQAIAELSLILRNKQFTPPDIEKSLKLAIKAHELGSARGTYAYALHLHSNDNLTEKSPAAVLFMESYNRGHLQSAVPLAKYEMPEATKKELLEGYESALRRKDLAGDSAAQFQLSELLYWQEKRLGDNDKEAADLLRRAAAQNYLPAVSRLGEWTYCCWPRGISPDPENGVALLLKALRSGFMPAVGELVSIPTQNRGILEPKVEQLFDENKELIKNRFNEYMQDWDLGRPEQARFLQQVVRRGEERLGINRDVNLAYRLLGHCYDYEISDRRRGLCANWMGIHKKRGLGTRQSIQEARIYFELAHELNDPNAANNLGILYLDGNGVEQDYERASALFYQAVERSVERGNPEGHPEANFHLGTMNEDGVGVAKDEQRAATFYERAIEAQYPQAFMRLAGLHEGELIEGASIEEAIRLYERASDRNRKYELTTLGELEDTYQKIAQAHVNRLRSRGGASSATTTDRPVGINFGSFHALVIGNSNYKHLPKLQSSANDARRIAKLLEQKFGFEVDLLLDASRRDILVKLDDYKRNLQATDNFLLFYAGHGEIDETGNDSWQPIDADQTDVDWIETEKVNRVLRVMKSRNAIVIADSCYSGAQFRGANRNGQIENPSQVRNDTLVRLLFKKTRVAITSGGEEPVPDSVNGGNNSVFTDTLAIALTQLSAPATAMELFATVQPEVISITARAGIEQTPQYGALTQSDHEGGDFIFVPRA